CVLKADIEGAEPELIKGGSRLLTVGRPDLVLEANSEAAITTLSQMLSQYDYRLTRRLDDLNLLFQRN
ncbi:MAG: FkbM family methyltransferase, partial [Burkholderiales bacterium]